MDHASNQLRSGAADLVLAGGVHHCHDLTLWSVFCQLRALSPTEQIRPFSRDADGILVVPPGDRPHGWIEVRTESGVGQLVFAARQELADSMVKGSSVSFRLEVGPRGAFATAIEPSDVESAA